MALYVVRRLISTVPILLAVGIFVFFLLRMTPGDPAVLMAGDNATMEQVEAIRKQLGFDRPTLEQLFSWGARILQGDLGRSVFSGMEVSALIAARLEPTALLAIFAVMLALIIALPLGILAAVKSGTIYDRAVMGFAMVGFSSPVFVIGFLLSYVFAVTLGWFPIQGYVPLRDGLGACLTSLFLPALTLSMVYAALIARITRTSLLEVLSEDYVRTARAKGLGFAVVVLRHALQNSAIPIVTVVGIGMAALLGGVVVTETVFNIPGLGRLTTDAILRRDYAVVQALILLFSTIYVLINLLVDISYALFDPRIRY